MDVASPSFNPAVAGLFELDQLGSLEALNPDNRKAELSADLDVVYQVVELLLPTRFAQKRRSGIAVGGVGALDL